jgi:hypothetical protein
MSLINSVPTTLLDTHIISSAMDFLNTGVFGRINARSEDKNRARRKTWEYGYAFPDLIKGKHHFKGVPR